MSLNTHHATIELFKRALEARGFSCSAFTLGGSSYTAFTAPNGAVWLTRNARIGYPMVSAACKFIAVKKELSYELCAKAGITVPRTVVTDNFRDSRNEISSLLASHAVVVKPNDASLSWGLTLNVRTPEQAEIAFKHAQEYSEKVVIQQQITGQEIRFMVVNGKTRAALLRQTPRVVGDGKSTVSELLAVENEQRTYIAGSMVQYPQLNDEIIDFSLHDTQRIPANGEIVELGRSSMIRGGASIYNLIDTLDEGYKAVAERAAAALYTPFVSVDIMIKDISLPCNDDGYAFIEFNSAPVLALCYSTRDGKQYDVVADIVPLIEKALGVTP